MSMSALLRPTVLAALSLLLVSASSFAATARSYVASYGSDASAPTNCGPTAPCRTFAAAMGVTNAGGEIIVLDSAGYGTLNVTKSISIIAPEGIYAGLVAAPGGTAVSVATAGVVATLRGLNIAGQGAGFGISMTAGSELHVERCNVSGFGSGIGLSIAAAARVTVTQSTFRGNDTAIAAGHGANLSISDSRILENQYDGIVLAGGSAGAVTRIGIADTVITGSLWCVDNYAAAGTTGTINATRVTASGCDKAFYNEPLGTGTINVSGSMVTGNNYGFVNTSGTFGTYGNNHLRSNTTATAGVISLIDLQ